MSILIDKCSDYIEQKDCYYLAKEGFIVYYSSDTGRKSDYTWKKLSIMETVRIIKATRLGASHTLKPDHLIAAFQELGRVFEYGVKSRHAVSEGIFNYYEHSKTSLGDLLVSKVAGELLVRGFNALLYADANKLIGGLNIRLDAEMSAALTRDMIFKHFETLGYIIKTGSARPLVDGKLQPTIMQPNTKPRDVVKVTDQLAKDISNKVYGELK